MPRKTVAEKAALKRMLDAARGKTRVYIGSAFERWRRLKELHPKLKNDEMIAEFLLDSYESTDKKPPSSAACLSDRVEVKVEEEQDNSRVEVKVEEELNNSRVEVKVEEELDNSRVEVKVEEELDNSRVEVKVEEELDNSNSKQTSAQPVGASIELEWDPNDEADAVSEDEQMGSEEDDAGSKEDPWVSEEDEISEEDVNYHDDSDDDDYRPPNRVKLGDGLKTSVHISRADKRRKRQCEDTEEKLEATSSRAVEDNDVREQINMTETQDNSTAAPGETYI